jgi:glycosyltransferase involved in cell wall biosynthesis
MNQSPQKKYALQICHNEKPPFGRIGILYAEMFRNTDYIPVTVFLTGDENKAVLDECYGIVIFLGNKSSALSGLKIAVLRELLSIYKQYDFEFILAHRYKSIYLANLLTLFSYRRVVYGVVHSAKTFERYFRQMFMLFCQRRLVILAVSESLADEVARTLPTFPSTNIRVLYNSIDAEQNSQLLSRTQARSALGISEDAFVLGCVARLHAKKNHTLLLEAFAQVEKFMPAANIVLIGDGPLETSLREQVSALGLNDKVVFCGFVNEASRYYKAFDVFVLTSTVETFGVVLLESMVAGVPVIASRVGGVPEVVGSVGLLFDSGSADQLAVCMRQVYAEFCANKSPPVDKMRAWVEQNFSITAVSQKFWGMRSKDQTLFNKNGSL